MYDRDSIFKQTKGELKSSEIYLLTTIKLLPNYRVFLYYIQQIGDYKESLREKHRYNHVGNYSCTSLSNN